MAGKRRVGDRVVPAAVMVWLFVMIAAMLALVPWLLGASG